MRWSAAKLRWVLLGGALLLAGVLAGFFGLARYRAGQIWQRILARNGVNLRRETNGFTYSQSSGGRTVFTVHASKAIPEGKNKWALRDAVLILYGHQPGREDRIYGKQFEYDGSEEVARAVGEVHMDLQVPEPAGAAGTAGPRPELSFGPEDEAAADPGVIHVRTSGLVYMHKLGIAATGETTEFRYGGMTCVSRGAEFDSGPSVVRLLADVRLTGTVRDAPFTLTAAHAELDRDANTAALTGAVLASADRDARAGHALLHLHKDGSLAAGEAGGEAEMRAGTRTIAAPQAAAVFGPGNRPQHVRWFTGVRFADADLRRPSQGSAGTLDLLWAPGGTLSTATATGAVRYAATAAAEGGAAVKRQLVAEQAVASFVPGEGTAPKKSLLRQLHLTGAAEAKTSAQGVAPAGRPTLTAVSGDDLTATFQLGERRRPELERLHGTGHTRFEQLAADGARQRSQGETLDVAFAPGPSWSGGQIQVASAVQSGTVEVQSWAAPKALPGQARSETAVTDVSTGRAARAVFAGAEKTLTLGGSGTEPATVERSEGVLAGALIVLHQATGDAEVSGGVTATDWARPGGADANRDRAPATHVQASRARLLHAAVISEFFGDADHPAQLWQGGSQVRAAQITLDGKTKGMTARPGASGGLVDAVFAAAEPRASTRSPESAKIPRNGRSQAAAEPAGAGELADAEIPQAGRSAVRVSAERMDYDDIHHEAVFTGKVRMRGVMGEASAERGTAFLRTASSPEAVRAGAPPGEGVPGLSGTLDRMVLLGNVRLTEPGRTAAGEQLTYAAATDSFVLTGTTTKPPRVTGEQGSTVTGATLLFQSRESTVVVAGAKSGTPGQSRVHTETDLKPQTER